MRTTKGEQPGDGSQQKTGWLGDGGIQVGRAGNASPSIVTNCPDQGRVAADRNGSAKTIERRSVGSGELGD